MVFLLSILDHTFKLAQTRKTFSYQKCTRYRLKKLLEGPAKGPRLDEFISIPVFEPGEKRDILSFK